MTFPALSEAFRVNRLQHPRRKARIVLDTDTYNEIDGPICARLLAAFAGANVGGGDLCRALSQ